VADSYDWWKRALANPKGIGKGDLIATTEPQCGFYKRRMVKGGAWVPVWIFVKPDTDSELGARITVDGRTKDVGASEQWEGGVYQRPIAMDVYEAVAERGEPWPDADPDVSESRFGAKSNEPEDEAEILASQIESAGAAANKYAKFERWTGTSKARKPIVQSLIKTDADAAKAQEVRSRLLELYREGEKKFETEKRPVNEEAHRIGERWRFRQDAQDKADIVRAALSVYETEKLQKQRAAEEASRKAQEEAANREAEIDFMNDEPEPEVVAPPPATAPVETTIKGSSGRAATKTTVFQVTEVTDVDVLFAWKPIHDHREMVPFLLNLARRAYKDGGHRGIPGVKIDEVVDVR